MLNHRYIYKQANDSVYKTKDNNDKLIKTSFIASSLMLITLMTLYYANTEAGAAIGLLKIAQVLFVNGPVSVYLVNKLFKIWSK
jgi:hypothetical protein